MTINIFPRKIENPKIEVMKESVTITFSVPTGTDINGFTVYKSHCVQYSLNEYSTPLNAPESLAQIETWFINHLGKMLPCIVVTEYGLEGAIYRYGNHGDFWEQIGTTCGYA